MNNDLKSKQMNELIKLKETGLTENLNEVIMDKRKG